MLISLIRGLFFFALVVLLTLGARWLMQVDGGVQLTFSNMEFTLGPLQAVIGVLVFTLLVWLALKVLGLLVASLRFIAGDETALTRYFSRRAERKGLSALQEGLLALAAGDGKVAQAKVARAERYLHRPELTNLVTAQAAELSGDRKTAEEVYKKLVTEDKTRFVGVRGLLRQRLAEGDGDTALKLAEKAFALQPKHSETQDILLRLQAEHADWSGARKTLSAKARGGGLPRDVHRRRDAVLAMGEAKDLLDDDKLPEAREAAMRANRLSPDLVPAAAMAARAYTEDGKPRIATRIIRKAWESQPHPDLAAAFAEIRPDETPRERLRRFEVLVRANPGHPETKMLLSELNIAAEDFPAARRALGNLASKDPTARALANMAAIERGEGGDEQVVRAWLAKALTARRGPEWVCESCHSVSIEWAPVCPHCGAFDTLVWKDPPAGQSQLPAGVAMLPLLVGQNDADGDTVHDITVAEPEDAVPTEPEAGETPDADNQK